MTNLMEFWERHAELCAAEVKHCLWMREVLSELGGTVSPEWIDAAHDWANQWRDCVRYIEDNKPETREPHGHSEGMSDSQMRKENQ